MALVFRADWLSHVPPAALAEFLPKVRRAVRPGGLVVIVDQYRPSEEDRRLAQGEIHAVRPLRDGRRFTIVKVFHDLERLQEQWASLGLTVTVERLDEHFFWLAASRR